LTCEDERIIREIVNFQASAYGEVRGKCSSPKWRPHRPGGVDSGALNGRFECCEGAPIKAVARPDRDNAGFVTSVEDSRDIIVKACGLGVRQAARSPWCWTREAIPRCERPPTADRDRWRDASGFI